MFSSLFNITCLCFSQLFTILNMKIKINIWVWERLLVHISSPSAIFHLYPYLKREDFTKEKEKENQKQKPESPVHQSVEQAAKERMPENPVMCQHCDSSLKRLAKKSCLNCCSSYCGRCFRRSHPSQEPFSNHEIVEPMKDFIKKIEQSNSCSNSAKCSIHKEKFTLYCSDCSQSCCRKCKSMECHRGHDLALLEDSYSNMKVSN